MKDEAKIETYRDAVVVLLSSLADGCEFAKKITDKLVTTWEAELQDGNVEMQDIVPAGRRYMQTCPEWPGVARIVDLAQHMKADRQRKEILARQIANRNAPALGMRSVPEDIRAEARAKFGITREDIEARQFEKGVRRMGQGIHVATGDKDVTATVTEGLQ
jgi:hypothetical protein